MSELTDDQHRFWNILSANGCHNCGHHPPKGRCDYYSDNKCTEMQSKAKSQHKNWLAKWITKNEIT